MLAKSRLSESLSFAFSCDGIFFGLGDSQEQRSCRVTGAVANVAILLLQFAQTSIENCDLGR